MPFGEFRRELCSHHVGGDRASSRSGGAAARAQSGSGTAATEAPGGVPGPAGSTDADAGGEVPEGGVREEAEGAAEAGNGAFCEDGAQLQLETSYSLAGEPESQLVAGLQSSSHFCALFTSQAVEEPRRACACATLGPCRLPRVQLLGSPRGHRQRPKVRIAC